MPSGRPNRVTESNVSSNLKYSRCTGGIGHAVPACPIREGENRGSGFLREEVPHHEFRMQRRTRRSAGLPSEGPGKRTRTLVKCMVHPCSHSVCNKLGEFRS